MLSEFTRSSKRQRKTKQNNSQFKFSWALRKFTIVALNREDLLTAREAGAEVEPEREKKGGHADGARQMRKTCVLGVVSLDISPDTAHRKGGGVGMTMTINPDLSVGAVTVTTIPSVTIQIDISQHD